MKRNLIFFILAICMGTMSFAQADLQPVAIVRLTKSEPITVKQLKTELEKLAWMTLAQSLPREPTAAEIARKVQSYGIKEKRDVLDLMINERLALQAAERDRITITDNEINQNISEIKSELARTIGRQPTDDEFGRFIRNMTGQDLPAFRDSFKRQSIVQKYLLMKKQDLLSSFKPITETEIVNFYNLSKHKYIWPDTVRFSMIQVPYGTDASSKTRAKELADRLNRDIGSNPSKFDEAVARGQSPNSGYQAGDGGYLPRIVEANQMAGEDFVNTAFSLKQGEVSKIIEGKVGYQIIKITETYSQRNLELDDIYEPGSRVTVRQYIGVNLTQQRQQLFLDQAQAELISELRTGNPFQIMENNLNF